MTIESVIDSAYRNSRPLASGDHDGCALFVADPDGVQGYRRLLECARELKEKVSSPPSWGMLDEDGRSFRIQHSSGASIAAIQGQQVITGEGLEVLAIGPTGFVTSGQSLAKTVDQIRGFNGLSILAWGVGKWIGRRGRLVTDFVLSERGAPDIMLADNGGRPAIWHFVRQFSVAREYGVRILAGSDPLPISGEERRIGSYGFHVSMQERAGETIVDAVRRTFEDPDTQISLTGKRVSLQQFISSQVGIRFRPKN
jgi:hypothetical protein